MTTPLVVTDPPIQDPPINPQESSSPPIPPTDQPQDGHSNEAFLQVLREKDAQIQRLQNQIATPPAPPPRVEPTSDELNQEFYNNPSAFFKRQSDNLERRLNETIAPMQEMYQNYRRSSVIDGFIANAK